MEEESQPREGEHVIASADVKTVPEGVNFSCVIIVLAPRSRLDVDYRMRAYAAVSGICCFSLMLAMTALRG